MVRLRKLASSLSTGLVMSVIVDLVAGSSALKASSVSHFRAPSLALDAKAASDASRVNLLVRRGQRFSSSSSRRSDKQPLLDHEDDPGEGTSSGRYQDNQDDPGEGTSSGRELVPWTGGQAIEDIFWHHPFQGLCPPGWTWKKRQCAWRRPGRTFEDLCQNGPDKWTLEQIPADELLSQGPRDKHGWPMDECLPKDYFDTCPWSTVQPGWISLKAVEDNYFSGACPWKSVCVNDGTYMGRPMIRCDDSPEALAKVMRERKRVNWEVEQPLPYEDEDYYRDSNVPVLRELGPGIGEARLLPMTDRQWLRCRLNQQPWPPGMDPSSEFFETYDP